MIQMEETLELENPQIMPGVYRITFAGKCVTPAGVKGAQLYVILVNSVHKYQHD